MNGLNIPHHCMRHSLSIIRLSFSGAQTSDVDFLLAKLAFETHISLHNQTAAFFQISTSVVVSGVIKVKHSE